MVKMLHQIWFDLGKGKRPQIPNGIESMKKYAKESGMEYKLWSEDEATEIISSMPERVQDVWKKLPHSINKIDFFRYILMYELGGIYFDVDFNCVKKLNDLLMTNTVFLCEEWPFSFKNGSLHNGVLICKSIHHYFWSKVIDEVEYRLYKLNTEDYKDIQKSVFKLTGTAMLRDVACIYLNERNMFNKIVVMPFGVFCPLVHEDGTYLDSYDVKLGKLHTQRWILPSNKVMTQNVRCFTLGFLGASVKIWQQKFH
jgi:mannosyltransferase OCH1-like enzyme